MKQETVLVTGGAGFIGSHLVERLINQGYSVRVLDNFSTGSRENLAPFMRNIELIEGDICDVHTVQHATRGVDFVLHQAALGSVPRSIDNPLATHETNITGTLKLLVAARDAGVKRLVNASSSSVYGDTLVLPKTESMTPTPLSPYALSKLTAETYCQLFSSIYKLETLTLRYFNVFGPRQNEHSQYAAVIPRFTSAMLHNRPITIFGDGEQTRDFTYIDNIVAANILAMTKPLAKIGQAINIGCGNHYSVLEVIRAISEGLAIKPDIKYLPTRTGDVKDSFADISKAAELIGYQPNTQFYEGIKKTTNWFKQRVMDACAATP